MGSKKKTEEKTEQPPPPRLQLFPMKLQQSPERSGMLTPPLECPASVPFTWEEEPGKPRYLVSPSPPQLLDLPPRLLMDSYKFPSPNTVLEGPYVGGSSKFQFCSSFRMNTMTKQQGSLSRTESLDRRRTGNDNKGGFFTSWKVMFKTKDGLSSSSSNSHCYEEAEEKKGLETKKMSSRSGSFSAATKSHHLWSTIYQGLKQVVVVAPWRRRSCRKLSKEEKASFLLH
ncbi:hypothetical protein LINGRAHAP2_LOCUS14947 [Linum grandiflorum]